MAFLVSVSACLVATDATGATFTVNAWSDAGYSDGTCSAWGIPSVTSDCTLRDAIDAANANPGSDTIVIGPIAQPGFSGTLLVDLGGAPEDSNATGDLDVWDSTAGTTLTIKGGSLLIDGNNVVERVFHTLSSGGSQQAVVLRPEDMALTGGIEVGSPGGCVLAEQAALEVVRTGMYGCVSDHSGSGAYVPSASGVRGGGAIAAYGALTLEDAVFTDNVVDNADGAAFYVERDLDLTGTVCEDNEVKTNGNGSCGAVYTSGATHVIDGGFFEGNVAARDGGGLYIRDASGSLEMLGTRLEDNMAPQLGGGLWLAVDQVEVIESVFESNVAGFRGGGSYWVPGSGSTTTPILNRSAFVFNTADGSGGGVFFHSSTQSSGTHIVRNTSIGNNDCSTLGGGGFWSPGCGVWLGTGGLGGGSTGVTVRIQHSTVVMNTAISHLRPAALHAQNNGHVFELENSIIEGHCEATVPPPGTYTSLGGNVLNSGGAYACPVAAGLDVTPQPMGTPLWTVSMTSAPLPHYDNAGLASSIDHATCPTGVTVDQLGTARPTGAGACDAGSIEQ